MALLELSIAGLTDDRFALHYNDDHKKSFRKLELKTKTGCEKPP